MKGQLSEHPLVELLQEITRGAAPGVLRVARERVRAVVCFDAGRVVFAASNLRAHRLGYLLRQWNALPAERLVAAGVDALSDEQAAAALLAAGAVTREELDALRQRQSVEALRPLLLWTDGEWVFDPRPQLEQVTHAPLDSATLLLEAARRLPGEFVARRLRDPADLLSPAAGLDSGQQLLPEEAFVLSRLDAPVKLSELLAFAGLPEAQTLRAVYALAACGLVRRGRAPEALPADLLESARAAHESARAATAQSAAEASAQTAAQEAAQEEADPLAEVEALFAQAGAGTHYEVLGVGRRAPSAEIKRAYYALARRFHPDRFRRDADEALLARVEAAFARVARAYEVLKDDKLRATYDTRLAREPAPSAPPTKEKRDAGPSAEQQAEAEALFRRGVAAQLRGEHQEAARLLGQAVALDPRRARYRAHYGRSLAHDRATRRKAEGELQAAVAAEPDNVEFRIMLAELYRDIGLRRRAESELEHALKLQPTNPQARRILQTLRQG